MFLLLQFNTLSKGMTLIRWQHKKNFRQQWPQEVILKQVLLIT